MLVQGIGATFGRWGERRRRNTAISELRALDDRALKDMGLTRGEIVAAVDGRMYRGEPARPHEPKPPARCAPEGRRSSHGAQRGRATSTALASGAPKPSPAWSAAAAPAGAVPPPGRHGADTIEEAAP